LKVAIIGAGLAGATLAQQLYRAGHEVSLFEKSRGAGGRMATRRANGFAFDHGAPWFEVQDPVFHDFLAPHVSEGVISEWPGRFVHLADGVANPAASATRYVAIPAMNALAKTLVSGIDLRTGIHVAPLREPHLLHDSEGAPLGRFDWIISTAPGPQTAALFADVAPLPLAPDHMSGGFTAMFGFAEEHELGFDAARTDDGVIASIIVNSAKPGRESEGAAFVVHAQTDWAEARINEEPTAIRPLLAAAFARLSGIDAGLAMYSTAHRWRYAHANEGFADGFAICPDAGLAACGDWCWGGGVEAAFISANALAAEMLSFA
jgi:renalase